MSEQASTQHHKANTCRHFSGLLHQHCFAGVRYEDVRNASTSPCTYPCFKSEGCSDLCSKVSYPEQEQK